MWYGLVLIRLVLCVYYTAIHTQNVVWVGINYRLVLCVYYTAIHTENYTHTVHTRVML